MPDDFKFPTIAVKPADRQFPISDGDGVFRLKNVPRKGDSVFEHSPGFALAFGDADEVQGLPLVEALMSMERHVRIIMDSCERRFFR